MPPGPGPAPSSEAPDQRLSNRELSWLDFNERVLALAEDPSLPVLERARFLAIFNTNLDEFFQVRVGGLREQVAAGVTRPSPDGMTPGEQLRAVRARVAELATRQERCFFEGVVPVLAEAGVRFSDWPTLDALDRAHLHAVFEERIFPVLTPLSVDPAHPFPYISNLSLNLAVVVRDPETRVRRFARVKVPPLLPRFVLLPDGERFVPVEQVIAAHLGQLFPGMEIVSHNVFRVTRNAELTVEEDEAEDLLDAIQEVLRLRRRSPDVVRLEMDASTSREARDLLMQELRIGEEELYEVEGPLDLGGLWHLYDLERPDLKEAPWTPVTQARLGGADGEPVDLFRVLREGDVLVEHPYDSFDTSVEAFVAQAAGDPAVLAIKQSLYRTSSDSPIVRALIRAAESGKQVVALVELKARFDEQANIAWARALEEAGVHVVYGLVGLKTHAKTALVVRVEESGVRRYCHIGTGNYNGSTARVYEDLGLLTADPELAADVTDLFNFLTGYSRQHDYRRLLVAPVTLRTRIRDLIRREAGRPDGRIVMKMNSLVDADLIEDLYAASCAGTEIDLIVRGICCLRPGVPGMSERIRVRSIVGRFLEHSRIFRFGSDARAPEYYIGSADLMPRNLDRRVEAVTPVTDAALRERLQEILDVDLADDVLAWELGPDETWRKLPTVRGANAQVVLRERAVERAARGGPHRA